MTDYWKPIAQIEDLPSARGRYIVTLVLAELFDVPKTPIAVGAEYDDGQKMWLIETTQFNALLPVIGEANGVDYVSHWRDMPEPSKI